MKQRAGDFIEMMIGRALYAAVLMIPLWLTVIVWLVSHLDKHAQSDNPILAVFMFATFYGSWSVVLGWPILYLLNSMITRRKHRTITLAALVQLSCMVVAIALTWWRIDNCTQSTDLSRSCPEEFGAMAGWLGLLVAGGFTALVTALIHWWPIVKPERFK